MTSTLATTAVASSAVKVSLQSTSPYLHHHKSSQLSFLSSFASAPGFVGNARFTFQRKEPSSSSITQTPAAVRHLVGSVTKTQGLRFAVVVVRFNEIITKPLLDGALETFNKYSVLDQDIDIVWVPGSFEVGLVAETLGKSGNYHAILCIGAVIRGDTSHYDAVANSAASGVLSAGLSSGVPCIFGVLTCEDMDQALNRAGGKAGNKGADAALTANPVPSDGEGVRIGTHLSETERETFVWRRPAAAGAGLMTKMISVGGW